MSGKRKMQQFEDMKSFPNVLQVGYQEVLSKSHPLKGNWRKEIFNNNNEIVLELGCGKGEYSIELARLYPDKNFIGVDIKGARMWRGAKTAIEEQLNNAYFLRSRIEFIDSFFAENEVDEIWITFPDPQPQLSREKKRLTSPRFYEKYLRFLKKDGIVNLKTDSAFLYEYSLGIAKDLNYNVLVSSNKIYSELNAFHFSEKEKEILKIKTFYEQMFTEKGHEICYLRVMPHKT